MLESTQAVKAPPGVVRKPSVREVLAHTQLLVVDVPLGKEERVSQVPRCEKYAVEERFGILDPRGDHRFDLPLHLGQFGAASAKSDRHAGGAAPDRLDPGAGPPPQGDRRLQGLGAGNR